MGGWKGSKWRVHAKPGASANRQHAILPRRAEPVPEGVARRAKGGARRGRIGIGSGTSCGHLMHIRRKPHIQFEVWTPIIV